MQHDHFASLFAAVEARSPIRVADATYGIWLMDLREPEFGASIDVVVGAKGIGVSSYTGELHLDRSRLDDYGFIVDRGIETLGKIIRGELPQGHRVLL